MSLDRATPEPPADDVTETSSASSPTKAKIDILLKATGDAPIMKKKKWAVERSKKVAYVSEFIRKFLKIDAEESLFLYVSQSFAPALDVDLGTLYDNFGSDNKLVLHYCKTQAWG